MPGTDGFRIESLMHDSVIVEPNPGSAFDAFGARVLLPIKPLRGVFIGVSFKVGPHTDDTEMEFSVCAWPQGTDDLIPILSPSLEEGIIRRIHLLEGETSWVGLTGVIKSYGAAAFHEIGVYARKHSNALQISPIGGYAIIME